MTDAIRTERLTRSFKNVHALWQVDMNVPEGAIFALLGPNGAGKSTAVKLILNLIEPSSGASQVLGVDSRRLRGRHFQSIGYVAEKQDLPEWMRVGDFFDYLRPFYPKWDRALEDKLLLDYDLPLDRKLSDLSLGMRMKLRLASSVAFHPRLLVLDEPFSGLDPITRDELIEQLLDCAREATLLICSHDLAEIETFSSHVGYLDRGNLLLQEEMTSLLDRFREVEVTLDQPFESRQPWPKHWLLAESERLVAHFTESTFDEIRTRAEIRRLFPSARSVAFSPMSLRSISLAIAKSNRITRA
jgi:ABC-2 type transport system ATP-binding protein